MIIAEYRLPEAGYWMRDKIIPMLLSSWEIRKKASVWQSCSDTHCVDYLDEKDEIDCNMESIKEWHDEWYFYLSSKVTKLWDGRLHIWLK